MPTMFGLGMGEIVLIAVVALLVVGPDKLPGAAKAIGKGIRDLRASTKDLTATIEQDTQIGDAVRELRGALRGDPETLYKRATGEDFNAPGKTQKTTESSKDGGDTKDEDANSAVPPKADATDGETSDEVGDDVGDVLDEAYANTDDGWGTAATNPHEQEANDGDPDLPVLKQPAGSVARGAEAPSDVMEHDSSEDDPSDSGNSSHG